MAETDNIEIQRLVARMKERGIPVTRENFIKAAFGHPVPDEMVDEEMLPRELRITDPNDVS